MHLTKITALAFAIILGLPSVSEAATQRLNIQSSFSGGELGDVALDVTITHDFSLDAEDITAGVVVNGLTSSVVPGNPIILGDPAPFPVGFDYSVVFDTLIIGAGDVNGITTPATDFVFVVRDLLTAPIVVAIFVSEFTQGGSSALGVNDALVTVTELPAPVPLPFGAWMMLSGLGVFSALRVSWARHPRRNTRRTLPTSA